MFHKVVTIINSSIKLSTEIKLLRSIEDTNYIPYKVESVGIIFRVSIVSLRREKKS